MSKKKLPSSPQVVLLMNKKQELQEKCKHANGNQRRILNKEIKVLKAQIQELKRKSTNDAKVISLHTNVIFKQVNALHASGSF